MILRQFRRFRNPIQSKIIEVLTVKFDEKRCTRIILFKTILFCEILFSSGFEWIYWSQRWRYSLLLRARCSHFKFHKDSNFINAASHWQPFHFYKLCSKLKSKSSGWMRHCVTLTPMLFLSINRSFAVYFSSEETSTRRPIQVILLFVLHGFTIYRWHAQVNNLLNYRFICKDIQQNFYSLHKFNAFKAAVQWINDICTSCVSGLNESVGVSTTTTRTANIK